MRKDEGRFMGGWETGCVITNLLIYKIFTRIPLTFTRHAGPSAFFSAVVSGVAGIALIWLLLNIIKKNIGKSLIDISAEALGKFGRYILTAIISVYIIVSAVYALQEFSELIKLMGFPTSPLWFVKLFLIIAGIFGAFYGVKTIFRVHAIFVPVLVGLTLLIVFSAMEYGNLSNLFPLFGRGTEEVLRGGLSGVFIYSDIILILLFNPFGEDFKKMKRTTLTAAIVSFFINTTVVFALAFTIPYPSSAQAHFPIYSLLKEVWYGRFFQRIDAIYMFFISVCAMLYLSFLLGVLSKTIKDATKTQSRRAYIVPLSLAVLLFSLCESIKRFFTTQSLYLCGVVAVLTVFFVAVVALGRCGKDNAKN